MALINYAENERPDQPDLEPFTTLKGGQSTICNLSRGLKRMQLFTLIDFAYHSRSLVSILLSPYILVSLLMSNVQIKWTLANSVTLNQLLQHAASDQGLHCLVKR